jgi:holo-[acyl-carrier protein] synthase
MHVGIDIVEIDRILTAAKRSGKGFMALVYTAKEIKYIGDPEENAGRAAGIWAAKEAAVKALGTGFQKGVVFHDLEIEYEEMGRPYIVFAGKFRELMQASGLSASSLSISHCATHAVAAVVLC